MDGRKNEIESYRRLFKKQLQSHISYESAEKLYGKFGSDYEAAAGFYWIVRHAYEKNRIGISHDALIDDLIENYEKWVELIREADRGRD